MVKALLDNNQFYGEVPASYCHVQTLSVHNNRLTEASAFISCAAPIINLRNNSLQGTIPHLNSSLTTADFSYNMFVGRVPEIPQDMLSFLASSNRLSGPLPLQFIQSVSKSRLYNLGLDSNALKCPLPDGQKRESTISMLFYSNITHMSLASNNFHCALEPIPYLSSPLINLDLSNNKFFGSFEIAPMHSIIALSLANNRFNGTLLTDSSSARNLGSLDASQNRFKFELSSFFTKRYYLSFANMSNNNFGGGLKLTSMNRLQIADLTNTALALQPDLASIGEHFTQHRLQMLSITDNRLLPPFNVQDVRLTGLNMTEKTSPTIFMPNAAFCYQMAFTGQSFLRTFLYDQFLFNYEQCRCDSAHFGHVSLHFCFACPVAPSSSDLKLAQCGGETLVVPTNMFIYDISDPAHLNRSVADWNIQLRLEVCPRSACRGLNFVASDWPAMSPELLKGLLDSQCAHGSEGRLCSRCICDLSSPTTCYYATGKSCAKCTRTFPLRTSAALATSFLLVVIIVVSIIMAISLRSKRTKRTKAWSELKLSTRIFYRLLHLTSLGNVSILIAFLQLLITLTHWDSYILGGILSSLNGQPEGLGLLCLFPILSLPMASLLLKLLIPIVCIIIVGISVLVAALVSRILDRSNSPRAIASHNDSDLDSASLLGSPIIKNRVEYPATALFTSVALSVLKFFYLGTALAAHEYLFSSTQAGSGTKYVQNHPWMKYEAAIPLIGVSIPWLVTFDFVLPLLFVLLCWRVRKTFKKPEVAVYFGTFFETFSARCFWWEIVNIYKKLAITLIVQGIADSSALQSSFAVSILAGMLFVQFSLQPWKRSLENSLDSLSSLILIGATIAARSTHLSDSFLASILFFALSVIFVLLNVVVIGYETYTEPTAYELQISSSSMIMNDAEEEGEMDWKELSSQPNTRDQDDFLLD